MPRALTAGPAAFSASLWALLLHRQLQLARTVFKQTAAVKVAVETVVQWRIDGLFMHRRLRRWPPSGRYVLGGVRER